MLNFNALNETEVYARTFQLRLRQRFLSLQMRLIDRSIDHSTVDRNPRYIKAFARLGARFQLRLDLKQVSNKITQIGSNRPRLTLK